MGVVVNQWRGFLTLPNVVVVVFVFFFAIVSIRLDVIVAAIAFLTMRRFIAPPLSRKVTKPRKGRKKKK